LCLRLHGASSSQILPFPSLPPLISPKTFI